MEEVAVRLLKNQVNKLIIMKYWPVPDSYSKDIPVDDASGSFWEDRGDGYHCGVDIYAPTGSDVLSIEDGEVIDIGIFTAPDKVPYWNITKYVIIKSRDNLFFNYAELADVIVKINQFVKAGQLIGHIGSVLDFKKINENSPKYIQKIKSENKPSMLHFEVYASKPFEAEDYLGGNWFGRNKPKNLLNPVDYL
jgi:murein DD-endopeptidase MepM/ murein hydrolase activator NlpD